jgi:hypothetical protein
VRPRDSKEGEPLADDEFGWTDPPGAADVGGPAAEFVDIEDNPPGTTGGDDEP